MDSEEIVLIIENISIVCHKKVLIENSDYFKAMLQGSFVESSQRSITLESVSLKAINIILTVLWDDSFLIEDEDVLCVLRAACMLQFLKIKSRCIDKLIEILSPKNCIQIWITSEQLDIIPLYLKAKCMALDEFDIIKELDCLMELNLDIICLYLGHACLAVKEEFHVFQTVMKWWYENQEDYENQNTTTLLKLFSCIDFNNLEISLIKEMLTYPDLADRNDVCSIFNCIIDLKTSCISSVDEQYQILAKQLLNSRKRHRNEYICILLQKIVLEKEPERIRKKVENSDSLNVVIYDKFKRKRLCTILDHKSKESSIVVAYYDCNERNFKPFFEIGESKCKGLDGCKIIGYKEFIFMYGGEYLLGKGNWNYNFWIYDTFKERWERKTRLPYPRRHFESCLVNSTVYIVGGTGNFRIVQENIFGYNFKDDTWSKQVKLPCPGRQIKCCSFLDQLFLLSLSEGCGYLYNEEMATWTKVNITDEAGQLKNVTTSTCFSYKDRLFIKGKVLIELQKVDENMIVTSVKCTSHIPYETIESVRCHTDVFTLYKSRIDENIDTYSLERYNLNSGYAEFIFKEKPVDSIIETYNGNYTVSPLFKIFSFHHHSLVRENVLINENFIFQ